MEQFKRRRYNQKNHKTLEEGVKKKQNHIKFNNRKRWRLFQHQEEVSKIQHLKIKPQTELVGEDNIIAEQEVDIKPLVPI
jgi:hypothetical protein